MLQALKDKTTACWQVYLSIWKWSLLKNNTTDLSNRGILKRFRPVSDPVLRWPTRTVALSADWGSATSVVCRRWRAWWGASCRDRGRSRHRPRTVGPSSARAPPAYSTPRAPSGRMSRSPWWRRGSPGWTRSGTDPRRSRCYFRPCLEVIRTGRLNPMEYVQILSNGFVFPHRYCHHNLTLAFVKIHV